MGEQKPATKILEVYQIFPRYFPSISWKSGPSQKRLVDDRFGMTVCDGGQAVLHDLDPLHNLLPQQLLYDFFFCMYITTVHIYIYIHIYGILNTYRYAFCMNAYTYMIIYMIIYVCTSIRAYCPPM